MSKPQWTPKNHFGVTPRNPTDGTINYDQVINWTSERRVENYLVNGDCGTPTCSFCHPVFGEGNDAWLEKLSSLCKPYNPARPSMREGEKR